MRSPDNPANRAPRRIWFLRNGNHLVHFDSPWRPFGTESDERGRKTWWVSFGFGILVLASKDVRYPDLIDTDDSEVPDDY